MDQRLACSRITGSVLSAWLAAACLALCPASLRADADQPAASAAASRPNLPFGWWSAAGFTVLGLAAVVGTAGVVAMLNQPGRPVEVVGETVYPSLVAAVAGMITGVVLCGAGLALIMLDQF